MARFGGLATRPSDHAAPVKTRPAIIAGSDGLGLRLKTEVHRWRGSGAPRDLAWRSGRSLVRSCCLARSREMLAPDDYASLPSAGLGPDEADSLTKLLTDASAAGFQCEGSA
jgi:hypothetical protein